MKLASSLLFILSMVFMSNQKTTAQELNFDSLITKTWILESYEQEGKIFPPKEGHKEDKMVFNSDKTALSIHGTSKDKGIWHYDEKLKMLVVIDNATKMEMDLKVIEITQTSCILELENPANNFVRIHMVPEK